MGPLLKTITKQELADRLLPRDALGAVQRDAPPLPSEASGLTFAEADVLALMQAVRVPRAVAWDALKRANAVVAHGTGGGGGGGASVEVVALRDELMRVRLDARALRALAEEYAACRGLLGGGADDDDGAAASGVEGEQQQQQEQQHQQQQEQEREGRSAQVQAAAAGGGGPSGGQGGGATAGAQRGASRSPPCKVARRGARQSPTGPPPDTAAPAAATAKPAPSAPPASPPAAADGTAAAAAAAAAAAGKRARAAAAALHERHAPLLRLAELARACDWEAVQQHFEALRPGLLAERHPQLLFALLRARFARLAAAGDVGGALALARAEMTPLADADAALLPALKAAMAALLPGGLLGTGGASGSSAGARAGAGALSDGALAAALQEALAEALGLQGPRLVALLRALLAIHKTWFRAQRCSDPFAAALGVSDLRCDGAPAAAAAATAAAPAAVAAAPGRLPAGAPAAAPALPFGGGATGIYAMLRARAAAGAAGEGDGGGGGDHDSDEDDDDDDDDDDDGDVDEDAVLRVMEILEVPRGLAIELLAQHHGSVEDAVMQVVMQA